MENYIKNIIPNIKRYGKLLSQKEYFLNKSWLLINDKNDFIHYTFKKNGELIVSTNGNFVKGKWEILSSDKILIENEKLTLQLESLFFNENIIVLSKPSKSEELFILINEEEIKDKNPLEYLKNLKKNYDEDFGAEEFFYILLVGIIIFFTIVIAIVWGNRYS